MLWTALLLPVLLVLIGRWAGKKFGRSYPTNDEDLFKQKFARWLAGISSGLPIVLFCLVSLEEKGYPAISPYIPVFVVCLGGLSASIGVIVCIKSGRGLERFTGATACLLAIALLGLIVVGAMAGA